MALDGALAKRNILDVLEGDGDFVDGPDAAADAQATVGHHVPGRVVAKVDGNVGHDVGKNDDGEGDRRKA